MEEGTPPAPLTGSLTLGKTYAVLRTERIGSRDYYRIVDDGGDDYLYPTHMFEVVDE